MNAPVEAGRAWPRRKWWGVVSGLLVAQVTLLWWFGAHGPILRRPAGPAPQLRLAGPAARESLDDSVLTAQSELLRLNDPTLFAQGHERSFSGADWMAISVPEYRPKERAEPLRWLALDALQLGADFRQFVQANQPRASSFSAKADAPLTVPNIAETVPATAQPSTLHVAGALAGRRLLNPPALPPWPRSDLLTNSIVQVAVDADGNVIAPPVLLVPSGWLPADTRALGEARAARFNPLPRTVSGPDRATALTWGTLVFQWQTVPESPTNAPAASP